MATATPLYEQRDLSPFRILPPRPTARTAVVLDRRDGYRLVTRESPIDPMAFVTGRYRQMFRVGLAPLQVEHDSYQLPSSELARPFRVDFKLRVVVTDPERVVAEHKTDAWDAIEPVLRLRLRRIGRKYAPEKAAEVEEELSALLTNLNLPEAGLCVERAGVTANLEGPDLKRARDRIEDQHRRTLDEVNTRFRAELEKEEDEHRHKLQAARINHQHELDKVRERHHHDLETQRREAYQRAMGDEVLPKLLLLKLGARPAGGDPKEFDEIIELMRAARIDEFRAPLELLASHADVIERWQLEGPVNAVLERLVKSFEPRDADAAEELPAEKTIQDADAKRSDDPPPNP
jgi:hypothetical protein